MIEAYNNRALLTDLYELTMAAAYYEHNVPLRATFELFVRQLPAQRSYLVAAGLDSALGYLEHLHFTDEDVKFLRELPVFRNVSADFFDYLRGFRFSGEVYAMPEDHFGAFAVNVPAPLTIGNLVLESGDTVKGFLAEPCAIEGATEITEYGGWRNYLARAQVVA